MAKSLTDPFYVADRAAWAAIQANRPASDIDYLRAYFKENGQSLSDCEIGSATYLAWHGSLTQSGRRFEEHAVKLGLADCKLDERLRVDFESQKDEEARAKNAYAKKQEEEEERRAMGLLIVGGGGVAVVAAAVIGWVFFRRRSPPTNPAQGQSASDS